MPTSHGDRHAAQRLSAQTHDRAVPIKLVIVDVEDGIVEIPATRQAGGFYEGLWLLLRVAGQPRALIKRTFDGEPTAQIDGNRILDGLGVGDPLTSRAALPDPPPAISVVVPTTRERDDELRHCIESIAALDYPSFEVLLVDNSREAAQPPSWLADVPQVQLLREPSPGVSAARNRGLRAASGAIVAFTDDDITVDPSWLSVIASRLSRRPDEVGLTGLTLPSQLENPAQLALEQYYRPERLELFEPLSHRLAPRSGPWRLFRPAMVEARNDRGTVVRSFSLYEAGRFGGGGNSAFRVEVLRQAGGFDVRLGPGTPTMAGEDIELFARLAWAGHSLAFEPAALALHMPRGDDASLCRQIEGYGVGFTGAATALAFTDQRHLGAIAATLPRATRLLGGNFWRKLRTSSPAVATQTTTISVAHLARIEIRGMLNGPLAYLRSRRRVRDAPAP